MVVVPPNLPVLFFMPVLNIVGAALGVFLTPYLLLKKNRKQHDWLAGAFILALTVRFFAPLFIDHRIKPLIILIPVLPYFVGPLLYLLIRSIVIQNRIRKVHLLHFLPGHFMFFFIYFFAKVLPGIKKLRADMPAEHPFWSIHSMLGITTIISLFSYGIAASFLLLFISKNRDKTKNKVMRWPVMMVSAYLAVITFIFIFENSVEFSTVLFEYRQQVHATASVLMIVFFSYLNLQTREVSIDKSIKEVESLPLPTAGFKAEKQVYVKSGVDTDLLEEYKTKIQLFFESEKPYLDSEFSIDDLSQAVKINKHHLSQVFSRAIGESFYHYTNRFRVKEVIAMFSAPQYKNFSLLRLGLEAGFNSKTAFNRAFKHATSMTPGQYRKSRF